MQRYLIPLIVGGALAGACAGTYSTTAAVAVSTPDLVYVGPNVYAVANFPEPIFYSAGVYWRYDDGYWYRSSYYTGGWIYDPRPPTVIVRIDRPYARYYRDRGRVHIDYRYRPSDYNRPAEIRRHRSVHVERTRVRVIDRD